MKTLSTGCLLCSFHSRFQGDLCQGFVDNAQQLLIAHIACRSPACWPPALRFSFFLRQTMLPLWSATCLGSPGSQTFGRGSNRCSPNSEATFRCRGNGFPLHLQKPDPFVDRPRDHLRISRGVGRFNSRSALPEIC